MKFLPDAKSNNISISPIAYNHSLKQYLRRVESTTHRQLKIFQ